jgi:hypothetical protein
LWFGLPGTFSASGKLDGIEELLRIIRKEVNSMKIAIPFLTALL